MTQANLALRFVIRESPIAQGRPRISTRGGFARAYDPPKSREWKKVVERYAREAIDKSELQFPLKGPLAVWMRFVMPLPKSAHRKRNPIPERWSIKKPDVDNLYKGVADAMEKIVYENDSQIAYLNIEKKIAKQGTEPSVLIEIRTLDEEQRS